MTRQRSQLSSREGHTIENGALCSHADRARRDTGERDRFVGGDGALLGYQR